MVGMGGSCSANRGGDCMVGMGGGCRASRGGGCMVGMGGSCSANRGGGCMVGMGGGYAAENRADESEKDGHACCVEASRLLATSDGVEQRLAVTPDGRNNVVPW